MRFLSSFYLFLVFFSCSISKFEFDRPSLQSNLFENMGSDVVKAVCLLSSRSFSSGRELTHRTRSVIKVPVPHHLHKRIPTRGKAMQKS